MGSGEWETTAREAPRAALAVASSRTLTNAPLLPPGPSLRDLHATQLIVLLAMILLDGIDKNDDEQHPPKLVAEASSSSVPVARAHTPTPSLPDYEASQAQLRPTTQSYSDIQKKRTRRRRCRKYSIYILAAYFVLTVVIGVPVIVMVRPTPLTVSPRYNRVLPSTLTEDKAETGPHVEPLPTMGRQ